jgi:hypothetical protein
MYLASPYYLKVAVCCDSMFPDFKQPCFLVMGRASSFDVGDAAEYWDPEIGSIIHRVVGVCSSGYLMKGDNVEHSDGCRLPFAKVVAKACLG